MRPVGSYTDEARDHEEKLMADEERTTVLDPRKLAAAERAELLAKIEALSARHSVEISRRDSAAAAAGARLVEALARRTRPASTPAKYPRELEIERLARSRKPFRLERAPRAKNWRGPHFGKTFGDAEALRSATLEECAAGYEATWGRPFTERDREVYGIGRDVPEHGIEREKIAREVFGDLRKAIEAAHAFARTNYNQSAGAAMMALEALWEELPVLPKVSELPGYVKLRGGAHARLVHAWQELARQNLGWRLERRELAEMSILLAVGAVPYAQIIKGSKRLSRRKQVASVSDVIEWESNNLVRALRAERDPYAAGPPVP